MTYFVQDIVLKNAESWARLVRQSVTAAAIKSSKESFQLFRKAAIEKALKQKRVEEDKEEAPKESRYSHRNTNYFQCLSKCEFFK